MKIIKINLTSIRNKKPQLSQYLKENNIDIAILAETFLKPEQVFHIHNYNILRKDRITSTYGGVAILMRKSINFKPLSINATNANIEIVACEFNSNIGNIVIISIYIPPSTSFNSRDLNNIIQQIPANSNFMLCGDFNAHHPMWGDTNMDSKGTYVVNFIEDNNLNLLNDGSKTFFGCLHPSAIDLSICTPSLALVSSWSTLNESLGSSHCVIKI